MPVSEIAIAERMPTLDEYLAITDSVGWSQYVTRETARTALAHSLFAVVAMQSGECVGMGRVIGDGALFFYVQDLAVVPRCQGLGIGDAIMARLMSWLERNAPSRAFVGLFSASGKASFYERYGFAAAGAERPGMYQYIRLPGDMR